MHQYSPYLDWIESQHVAMVSLVEQWSSINSGSYNLPGLAHMLAALSASFAVLGGKEERIALAPMKAVNKQGDAFDQPQGQALRIRKRPDAPLQVFLCGHMDTVFGADHPFQTVRRIDDNTLNGPGAADLKGGLVIMLHALHALEQSPYASQIGWEILLNPDEEIGSTGSAPLLAEAAKRNHLGLIYEPSFADGTIVSKRKGTGNFTAVIRGRAAHAGRDFHLGRNAIALMGEYITALYALNGKHEGITVNPGIIEGGKAVNIVPDLAILKFNIRMASHAEQEWVTQELERLTAEFSVREGFSFALHGGFTRPPKPVTDGVQKLFDYVQDCGKQLGQNIKWQPSGGCCDGNNLIAHGLPNLDTLGVRGGEIHSDREFVLLDSLTERAKLSALLLMRLASGELAWPKEK